MIQGTVQCPAEYFRKMSQVDYSDWKKALAREFLQNSIDARAKNIYVTTDCPNNQITIEDDGHGMTLDVIQNKLLVLGGSAKEEGSVGAFGKAKELLYFSWKNWSIRTQNFLVIGQGPNFKIQTMPEKIKGTVSTITIDPDLWGGLIFAFEYVVDLMDTKTNIFINGNKFKIKTHRGRLIKSFNFGNLYLNKSEKFTYYMEIKVSGIWMYSHYLGTECGHFVLELSKDSIDCLTSNRDGLRGEYHNELMTFVRQLIVNEKSAITNKDSQIRTIIPGQGKIRIRPDLFDNVINHGLSVAAMKINIMKHINKMDYDLLLLKTRFHNEKILDRERWSFIGYKPDFELSYTKRQTNIVKRYMKKKKALKLAKIWTEIIKQVILDNSKDYMEFTAGFTFDSDTAAEVKKDNEGNITFYLNPTLVGKNGGWQKKPLSNRFLLSEELKDMAIHEVSHLYYTDHNENFVCVMHNIRAKVALNHDVYGKIARMK